ncbi:MAG: SDR family NAD(P)-dependent oxidoreductase [Kiritimatiellae bacterium]|nr:SDR family NAD(P)-dependent oxidoreductase [Kiritimatiellia bacterium]
MALARKVAPVMREQGGGMIVNIGSVSGVVTTPFSSAYCASKAALHALTDALRMELKPFGITVVCVPAGSVRDSENPPAIRLIRSSSRIRGTGRSNRGSARVPAPLNSMQRRRTGSQRSWSPRCCGSARRWCSDTGGRASCCRSSAPCSREGCATGC